MDNIIFIGMPASGKSTIGVVTAKRLGYGFIDPDILIQEQEGRLLHQIIEQDGIDKFRNIEDRVNAEIDARPLRDFTGREHNILRECYGSL